MTAQVTMSTPRLMLLLLLAPCVLLFAILVFMVASGIPVGFGRVLLLATFSVVAGLFIPILVLQVRATRMRKKMQDQFPVAVDIFVRGLRAGHPVSAAFDLLTVELADPIGSQFGMVVDEVADARMARRRAGPRLPLRPWAKSICAPTRPCAPR